jgi:hypothetical protein
MEIFVSRVSSRGDETRERESARQRLSEEIRRFLYEQKDDSRE